jgi:hypothetical protein
MITIASGYAWFHERPAGLSESYCLTLARDLQPAEFLERVCARPIPQLNGIGALCRLSMDLWRRHEGEELLIGVTSVPGDRGGWTLGVEYNGYLGVTEEVIIPLSSGTTVVSHYFSNGVDRFYWVEDGNIRLNFNPAKAAYREGSTPDAVLDAMGKIGFDLSEDGDNFDDSSEAALALAEYLTGARLTPGLLEKATYTCGIVHVPQG